MPLYTLIQERLADANISLDAHFLKRTDILEYTMLEAANALGLMSNEKLKCVNVHGNGGFTLFLGHEEANHDPLHSGPILEENKRTKLKQAKQLIFDKIPESTEEWVEYSHNITKSIYAISCPLHVMEAVVKNSSLYLAAGDLDEMDLETLIQLKADMQAYKNIQRLPYFGITDVLIERLTIRVYNYLKDNYSSITINRAEQSVHQQSQRLKAINDQELQFNVHYWNLEKKLHNLIDKGESDTMWDHTYSKVVPNTYLNAYQPVAAVARDLMTALKTAQHDFFNNPNPPTAESVQAFEQACTQAIDNARQEFGKFRGSLSWYNEIHPFFKGIWDCCKALIGIIAGVTIIPALLVQKYSNQGYINTFFKTQTHAEQELERFEQEKTVIVADLEECVRQFEVVSSTL